MCTCCQLSGEPQFGSKEKDFCELCDHDDLIDFNYKGIVPKGLQHIKADEWELILNPIIDKYNETNK